MMTAPCVCYKEVVVVAVVVVVVMFIVFALNLVVA